MLARFSNYAAWMLLAAAFAAAYWQGSEFASTKDTATVWGVVIGFAAYFAWLAVDLEEEAKVKGVEPHDDQDDEESGEESGEEGEAAVRVHAHDKMD